MPEQHPVQTRPAKLYGRTEEDADAPRGIGTEIVSAVPFPCPVAPLIRSHSERWDGMGYPSGLRGEQIPLGARHPFCRRLLRRVHVRAARIGPALSPDAAIRMIQGEAGQALDPVIVAVNSRNLVPVLTPPTNEGFLRWIGRPNDPASHHLADDRGERLGANAFAEIASAKTQKVTEIAQSMGRSMSLTETMTLVDAKLSKLVSFLDISCTCSV